MNTKFQVISPVDGSVYAERSLASAKEIDKVLAVAEKAQRGWKTSSIDERAAICRKAVQYFLEQAGEMAEELSWQMGRPIRYTPFEISKGFQERAHYMIDIAEGALADIHPQAQAGFRRFIRREPLGAILVLAPWNYPYLTSVNVVIPAIMAGNAVILKHAQQTPLCAERYAAAFEYAGLPEGVFQYLHLSHPQVAAVVADSRIAHVAFTGSVEGGKAIQQAVSHRFLAAGLELGGKDPAYVRADANLDYTIENLVDGAFFNSGQSCCGIERIYVHEQLFDPFVEGFVALAKQYVLGNPLQQETTLGPMVRTAAFRVTLIVFRHQLHIEAHVHIRHPHIRLGGGGAAFIVVVKGGRQREGVFFPGGEIGGFRHEIAVGRLVLVEQAEGFVFGAGL